MGEKAMTVSSTQFMKTSARESTSHIKGWRLLESGVNAVMVVVVDMPIDVRSGNRLVRAETATLQLIRNHVSGLVRASSEVVHAAR